MCVVLERLNHKVLLAESADAAVRGYSSARPDVVITDLLLPSKDGVQLVREIRRIDPNARIIVMSGDGDSAESRLLALTKELGALELISKPFRLGHLVAAIEHALNAPLHG